MKISYELPPMLDKIRAAGMNPVVEKTCFTYGDTLYNPGKLTVPEDYMRHEECHTVQQGADPDGWWMRYFKDPYFRIDQEAEAFAVQYLFFRKFVNHDRNIGARFLFRLADLLASPTYGSILRHQAAQRIIMQYAAKIRI